MHQTGRCVCREWLSLEASGALKKKPDLGKEVLNSWTGDSVQDFHQRGTGWEVTVLGMVLARNREFYVVQYTRAIITKSQNGVG